jgi:hypothetical protein
VFRILSRDENEESYNALGSRTQDRMGVLVIVMEKKRRA